MTERCANCGGDLVSDGKWATVHRPEECEITRILTTCPEGDRLAGVLRVVRAIRAAVAEAEARAREEERTLWDKAVCAEDADVIERVLNRVDAARAKQEGR